MSPVRGFIFLRKKVQYDCILIQLLNHFLRLKISGPSCFYLKTGITIMPLKYIIYIIKMNKNVISLKINKIMSSDHILIGQVTVALSQQGHTQ